MKHSPRLSIVTCVALLLAAWSLAPVIAGGRARAVQQGSPNTRPRGSAFPRQITLFDRQGRIVRTLGEPDVYQQPAFSPNGMRLAVVKQDPRTRTQDLWVFDVVNGTNKRLTFEPGVDSAPVWSPDAKQIAYFSFRGNDGGFYRRASDGTGSEELLYSEPRITSALTDWSPDGRFLSFSTGGVLFILPVNGERKPVELLRDEFSLIGTRFSPDGRFLAYRSDESGRNEIYVRPFDPSSGLSATGQKWKVSDEGGLGMIHWRQDGKELYYLAADRGVMAVEVTTVPAFKAESPRMLFRAPSAIPLTGTPEGLASISPDGQLAVFSLPTPPQRAEVTVAPQILAKYAGTYAGPGNVDIVVTLEGDQLMIQPAPGQGKFLLFASSETSFYFKTAEPEIEFVKDDKGNVTHFMLYSGVRATKATRK